MTDVKFSIEGGEQLLAEMRALGLDIAGALEEAALSGAAVIEGEAERNAPGPHIEMEVVEKSADLVDVAIGPDRQHWYYVFLESGAEPHEIGPDARQALAFEGSDGPVVTRKELQHPGVVAQPFLRPALDGKAAEAQSAVGKVLMREVARHGH